MQHSVVKALKNQLLDVILDREPEASIQIFAMAAMHGDIDTLDYIIKKVDNKLGNLEEMTLVRDSLAELLKDVEAAELREAQIETQAAQETQDLLKKFKL